MRKPSIFSLVVLSSGLLACGGGSGPAAPTTPVVPAPTRAEITVSYVSGTARLGLSQIATYTYALQFTVTVAESAGLGANADFVRMQLLQNNVEVERVEVTATALAAVGTNRVNARSSNNWTITMRFNAEEWDAFRLFFQFTDDKRNTIQRDIYSIPDVALYYGYLSRGERHLLETF